MRRSKSVVDKALDDLRVAAVSAAARRQGARPPEWRVRELLEDGLSLDAALRQLVEERSLLSRFISFWDSKDY